MVSYWILSILAAPCPERASWPTQDWPTSKMAATKRDRAAEIAELEKYLFTLEEPDSAREGLRTDGLLIVKGGELIYERYARGYSAKNRHLSFSVAKSITAALTGVAVSQNALRVTDSICDYVPARSELCSITVQNLMEFGSGLHWQEEYENETYQYSSVLAMLFGEGHKDTTRFILSHRKVAEPNTRFNYSTGEATLLAEVVRQAGIRAGLETDWFWLNFFYRIGMTSAVLSGDPKGAPGGGSWGFITPRDYAKFGYLYLNDGCWTGERVLPEGWVKSTTTVSQVFAQSASAEESTPNGWSFWLNQVAPATGKRPWPDAPDDAYSAIGHWGQYVVVVPSQDVVIVRVGDDRKTKVQLNRMIPLALKVAQ